ncbi:PriCT-2 domain-containing protein [Paraburkholderia terricola]|uniref:PriCT-2 domain-containing protein n=1 Tax=Paraburkholderia terricola TaxID=169427 RepID=UPI000DEFE267|nr:PriCT-2 domain-containing protein [Paraburkholderia terricola]AXE91782.1 hypothetical protein CUJ90_04905 [Paraburkholderia terricola]
MNAIIDDHQRIRDALSFIPPTIEREQWFRVGAAIKHEMGADGFELFDTWSRGDPAYIEADTHDTWRSIQAGRGITGATLFAIAKEYGFDPRSHKAMVIDPAEMERRRTERAARAKRDAEARVKQHKQAATLAAVILKKTKPARDDHPYLMRKGLAAISTLREIDVDRLQALIGYKPQSGGDALTGRILIAPVTIGAAVTTVEMIDETGRKSALAGGEKAGGAWIASRPGKTAARYLIAEGVATTLFTLNIWKMKQTAFPLLNEGLHGQINRLSYYSSLGWRKNEVLLVIGLPEIRQIFVYFLCHIVLVGPNKVRPVDTPLHRPAFARSVRSRKLRFFSTCLRIGTLGPGDQVSSQTTATLRRGNSHQRGSKAGQGDHNRVAGRPRKESKAFCSERHARRHRIDVVRDRARQLA